MRKLSSTRRRKFCQIQRTKNEVKHQPAKPTAAAPATAHSARVHAEHRRDYRESCVHSLGTGFHRDHLPCDGPTRTSRPSARSAARHNAPAARSGSIPLSAIDEIQVRRTAGGESSAWATCGYTRLPLRPVDLKLAAVLIGENQIFVGLAARSPFRTPDSSRRS